MRNRCKTLLRDHSVPEVTLKACPRHYSLSAVPETLNIWGPNRPPKMSGNFEKMSGNFGHLTHIRELSGNFVMSCQGIVRKFCHDIIFRFNHMIRALSGWANINSKSTNYYCLSFQKSCFAFQKYLVCRGIAINNS